MNVENIDGYADIREEWMLEISQARAFSKRDVKKNHARQFLFLLETLGDSTRRCMDPVDYVYGILGMLNIKIPRMNGPEAVWQRFLSELDNYMDTADIKNKLIHVARYSGKIIGIAESAYKIELQEAGCMGDVYYDVLDIEGLISDEE